MDVTIIPDDDGHAADVARALLDAAGPDRSHLVRTRSDVPGGLGFVVPVDIAARADLPDGDRRRAPGMAGEEAAAALHQTSVAADLGRTATPQPVTARGRKAR